MKLAAAAIAVCVIVGGTGTAYAANVGGIQRTIQLWMHGDQTSATFDLIPTTVLILLNTKIPTETPSLRAEAVLPSMQTETNVL